MCYNTHGSEEMKDLKEINKSIVKTYKKTIWKKTIKAIDEYKLKGKQKIDDELYEFTIFVDPKLEDGINTDENNKISNFFYFVV